MAIKKNPKADSSTLDFHDIAEQLMGRVMQAKDKYDSLDPKTKKKIIKGVAAAAATLAAVGLVKKMASNKKRL